MRANNVTDWNQVPLVIDLPFVSRLLGRSVDNLKKCAQSGRLPGAFKFGNQWRVAKDALRQHIEGRR